MFALQWSIQHAHIALLCCYVRNILTGWGRLDGKKVFVTADDFSVRGGHADGGIAGKVPYGEVRSSELSLSTCAQLSF